MRMCFLVTMEAMGKKKVMTGRGGLTLKPGSRLSRLFLIRPTFLAFGRSPKQRTNTKAHFKQKVALGDRRTSISRSAIFTSSRTHFFYFFLFSLLFLPFSLIFLHLNWEKQQENLRIIRE